MKTYLIEFNLKDSYIIETDKIDPIKKQLKKFKKQNPKYLIEVSTVNEIRN